MKNSLYFVGIHALIALLSSRVNGEVYFQENFDDGKWEDRWVQSEWKSKAEIGEWKNVPGDWFVDEADKGLKTSSDARFYAISAKLDKPFSNEDKDLVIQYIVKNEQSIDCGGAYIKLLSSGLDQSKFGGESSYAIMFGPDICGGTKKTHAILNFARPRGDMEAKNMDHKDTIKCESDVHAHVYTFVLKKDNTYEVKIDGEVVKSGELSENWPFQPPKQIKDPEQSKPEDWIDDAKIPDPEDKKPDGWDDIPAQIPDPDAEKPEDWDDEDDGDWEAPMIDNPEYKGEWSPRLIDNPEYKGEWEHPLIDNPDFFEDDKMHARCNPCEAVGIELWQVKSGTLFDDILVTDDIAEADSQRESLLEKIKALKEKKESADEEQRKEDEAKVAEEKEEEEEEEEEEEDDKKTEKDEL